MTTAFNPLEQLEQLKTQLQTKALSPSLVIDALIDMRGKRRFWDTTWWRNRRKQLIGSECQSCHTSEGPMVLQHFFHPRKISDLRHTLFMSLREKGFYLVEQKEVNLKGVGLRDACPHCGSVNIKYVRSEGLYKCYFAKCKQTSKWARRVPDPKEISARKKAARSETWHEAWNLFLADERVQFVIADVAIQDLQRYLQFSDVKTWCRKCAFMYDRKGKVICPKCYKGYRDPHYPTCYTCHQESAAPEPERRLA
jgi:Zn finger protein HypA/HybF involved in hydrogenase expression